MPTLAVVHIPAVAQFLLVVAGAFVLLGFLTSLFRGMRLAEPVQADASASDRSVLHRLDRALHRSRPGQSDMTLILLEPERPDEVAALAEKCRPLLRIADPVDVAGRQVALLPEELLRADADKLLERVNEGVSGVRVSRIAVAVPQPREKAADFLARARGELAAGGGHAPPGEGAASSAPELRYDGADRDALTGLLTQAAWAVPVRRLWQAALERRLPVAAVRADIDNMVSIIGQHGKEAGDAVLRRVGRFLLETTRRSDVVVTLGGDDFAVLMTAGPEGGQELAQRILVGVRKMAVEFRGLRLGLTMSLGVAGYPRHGRSPGDLLDAAERAMKAAVTAGRNRWLMAADGPGRNAGSASGF